MSTSNELRAKCRNGDCQHIWTVAHLPMDLAIVAKLAARAACPKCGDTKPLVAKEGETNNG